MKRTKQSHHRNELTTKQLKACMELEEIGFTKVTQIAHDEVEVEFLVPVSQLQELGVIKITETGVKFLTPSDENLDKLTDLICEMNK